MHTIVLDITDNNLSYHLVLDRRLNFIKGNSGEGKTTIAELVESSEVDPSINITCDYDCVVTTRKLISSTIKDKTHSLIIIDDLELVSSPLFASLVKEYTIKNDLCFLIMTREDSDDLSSSGRLSFSINNIFKLVTKDNVRVLERYYNFPYYSGDFDLCITEDTKSGFEFFSKLITKFSVKSSTSGKSTIISDVLNAVNEGVYKSILVILDTSAFGCHIEELYSRLREKDCNVSFISSYECFEELILRTNLVKNLELVRIHLNDLPKYANEYVSWETYFEVLLSHVTSGKLYHQRHKGNLNSCFYLDCSDCNSYKRDKCDSILDGTKLISLLKDTKYEFLLKYM